VALKALRLYQELLVPLNGAAALVVGVEPMGQLAIVAAAVLFLAVVVVEVVAISTLAFLDAVLAVELPFMLLTLV
jgi:hypothetical protein